MTTQSHRLALAADVPPGEMVAGNLPSGRRIAIYNVEGSFYATDDLCTHGQASLVDEGSLDGCTIECGLHLGAFDVRTGAAVAAPCVKALRSYPAREESGGVWVDVAADEA